MHPVSPKDKANLAKIVSALVNGEIDWIKDQAIHIGNKPNHWVLNYIQGGESLKHSEVSSLTRGLVVRKSTSLPKDPLDLIVCLPFIRFFNQGEPNAASIDLRRSELTEKLDGTMVGVFHDVAESANPIWQTRKMISADPKDMDLKVKSFQGVSFSFMPLIGEYVKKLNLSPEDKDNVFLFEFIHEASKVFTDYNPSEYGLYLIGGRRMRNEHGTDLSEYSELELDSIAKRIGSKRGVRFNVVEPGTETEPSVRIALAFSEMKDKRNNFEGFVFRDKLTGSRMKVKDPEYIRKHAMLGNLSIKNLLPSVLKEEMDEISAYFPIAKEMGSTISNRIETYVADNSLLIQEWRKKGLNGKSMAESIAPFKFQKHVAGLLFTHAKTDRKNDIPDHELPNYLRQSIHEMVLGTEKKQPMVHTALEILGLNSEEPPSIEL
jgi:hypothetical protein